MCTRMFNLKEKMKGQYTNFNCEACKKKGKTKKETQKHVYKCKQLNNNKRNKVKYNEIFKSNIEKIKQVIQKININLLKRNSIMKNNI